MNKWNREAAIDASVCVNPRFTPSSVLRISRQLRNRDAALRSREMKKMLVKDLEMKSRYYEGECRKMKAILSLETIDIPEGVEIKVKVKVIEVKGPRGTLTRNFKHLNLDFQLIIDEETGKQKLKVEAWFRSRFC
ncbi:hypothetical protein L1987_30023 [Smallanthus sonchifolius]|uniref:Uncharacterized protein n=1 Tax=Smallanthus sonchifolius TaxID=185202 RepID=A0ACB9I2C6_9ASTR|nr:hypothetical protein L1987_30023 [Smallanthus sonchifolius]